MAASSECETQATQSFSLPACDAPTTGSVVLEAVYGNFTEMLWRMNNQGKLYEQIDWSQFVFELDEEDEDDDEDDDDEVGRARSMASAWSEPCADVSHSLPPNAQVVRPIRSAGDRKEEGDAVKTEGIAALKRFIWNC